MKIYVRESLIWNIHWIFRCCFSKQKISAKGDEFFSLLVFKDISAKHSGRYTCYASNSAATVNYTSELLVKGENKKRKINRFFIINKRISTWTFVSIHSSTTLDSRAIRYSINVRQRNYNKLSSWRISRTRNNLV